MTLASDVRRRRPASDEAAALRRSVVLGRVGSTRISVAHAVFLAAAALSAVVMLAMRREGNGDLGRAALIGSAFWTAGWIVQLVAVLLSAAVAGVHFRWLSVGLLGVEISPHRWRPARAGALAVAGISAVLLCGVVVSGLASPPGDRLLMLRLWDPPSLGLGASDSVWHSGAWLLGIQAAGQLLPLPRTLGRTALLAAVSLVGAGSAPAVRLAAARRCITATALGVAIVGTILIPVGASEWGQAGWRLPTWLLAIALSLLLWRSSRESDLAESLRRLALGQRTETATDQAESLWETLHRRRRERQCRVRVAAALQRERGEAVDAARLDAILQQLHHHGPASLTASDRAVLERVSQSLRQHRERHSDDASF